MKEIDFQDYQEQTIPEVSQTHNFKDNKVKGSPKNRKLLVTAGAIAFSIGSVFGLQWWHYSTTHVTTENAQIKGHVSAISAKIPATIEKVLVKDGDYVQAGQPLIVLEDEDLALKVKQAEAKVAIAQAQLKTASDTVNLTRDTHPTQVQQAEANLQANQSEIKAAIAKVNQAKAAVETNRAAVVQAQTEVNKLQKDLQRYQQLYRNGAISAQQFESAQASYDNAVAKLDAANKTVAQAEAEVKGAIAQLQQANATANAAQGQVKQTEIAGQNVVVQQDQQQQAIGQRDQAQAELDLARQQLSYTQITAPVNGYVGQLTGQVGEKVQGGQPLLAVVPLENDQVYVEANFKETALGKITPGEDAEVEVDAYPGKKFPAKVAGISPATGANFALIPPDNATGNFNKVVQWVPVRLVFSGKSDIQNQLRPGLSVKVTVDTVGGKRQEARGKRLL